VKTNKLILGDGLLGSELVKKTDWGYLSRKKIEKFDFTKPETYELWLKYPYDIIINCIAHTDTYDKDRQKHWDVNYKGVIDLVDMCNKYNKKLIHISTDYIYTNSREDASEEDVPVHCNNWYGYTKLLGDGYVQAKSNDFLLLRGTHKKEPFTYDKAWLNQVGNFDYVSVISDLIIKLINKDCSGVYNIGTETKTMYDLAKRTKSDVKCDVYHHPSIPKNITMNLKKLKREKI
jgi:dTDP-4-dehydrorhamnose reductase